MIYHAAGQATKERIDMGVGSIINKLLYSASFATTVRTKNRHYRKSMENFNRGLAKAATEGWNPDIRREEYQNVVLPYWKRFGRRPKQFWFELAGSRDQRMDPRFIPSDLYYIELLPYINNLPFRWAIEDKNYLDRRFTDVKQAVTVCRRIAGEYYDADMELIQEDDAVSLCMKNGGELFIKPAVYSGFGMKIKKFDPSECTEEQIKELFDETGSNCIVQEKIDQHPALAALNPKSVSTVRVLSLFVEGSVYISLIYLRIPAAGSSHVIVGDEINAEILPDGRVYQKAWHDKGFWIDAHVAELYDDAFMVPGMDRICDEVRRLHPMVGHLKWIGWDFTIDKDGDPVLIELNTTPGDHAQRVCGRPLFGEMTDWILEDYFKGRSMEDFQARGSWTGSKDIRRFRE